MNTNTNTNTNINTNIDIDIDNNTNIDIDIDNNNSNNNDQMKISGTIGMVYLFNIKTEKNIYIYYDDHSNKNYCTSNDSMFLYDLFENIRIKDSEHIVLLEEPFINNYSNIKFLWNDVPHVIKFRNFYKKIIKKCSDSKICYIYPIDIRLIICDVSMDELISNLDDPKYFDEFNITTIQYFKYILYLFNYIDFDYEIFKNCDKNIIFIKKVFNTHLDSEYYKKLKGQFDLFYEKFIKPNQTMRIHDFVKKYKYGLYSFFSGYPFENSNYDDFLDQYDKLVNGIMEFYTFILATSLNTKNISIYSGYYHSNNLTYILKKYYDYNIVYQSGSTENIENMDSKKLKNCLYINKNIFKN